MEKQSVTPITPELAASLLPLRPNHAHKGDFGKVLVVAGSRQFPGAANLALRAALRSGAGLVYAVIPCSIFAPLAASIPEAIWLSLPEGDPATQLGEGVDLSFIDGKDSLLVGPGLGQATHTKDFLLALLTQVREHSPELPLVLDADALNLLSQQKDWPSLLPGHCVLTPHEVEFSRLSGVSSNQVSAHRSELASACARDWKQTVILKGANSLVVSPEGESRFLPFANSVLAHGGTGDVLAGLIAGLLAQKLTPFDAASLAVWLHSRAAELAQSAIGHPAAVLPSDIIQFFGKAMGSV